MARASFGTPNPTQAHAPDSPRSSESPIPGGIQGDLEQELLGLANALYNLGTTVVSDLTKDKDKPTSVGKQVGARVNDVIGHLSTLDNMSQHIPTMIPMQVLDEIDSARNPMQVTRDHLERAATENQFINGKIQAIKSFRALYNEALVQAFPDLKEYLVEPAETVHVNGATNGNGMHG
ncbi:hypothetical protein PHLGIDRAFT_65317 [Phlebiopsis gigantea 11061_1 CR5-6]|uniref:Mediator of RNA polymerase II transcription subunit 10 n=1 Tax=Phlebiopsis gigantea (strain 11061_1 CR5-6) TaxID=745531 RepID=A0A0C3PT06_PHLG1|nr:hypothetical protein PHLGIDRAFT_65317 [Phlebiopsis gigantea 11061_1 CR5-6]